MNFIPVNEPLLSGNEKKYLTQCIETGWISSEGPFVKQFEEQFSKKVDRKFGIAVANGTAALDIAIEALEIGKDDEVIMPTFTIISCITQIVRNQAKPIFVDSDPITWNMDISQIENKITKKTKAIMIVHIYGLPVNMQPVIDLAKKYNLKIIEDASEMIGQTYNNKPCGSFGDISTFSFYPNKHITTGEGGMIVTNNETLAEKCRSLRNLCFQPQKRFVHEQLGWNYRMTNLQAAMGVAQLENINNHIIRKREIGKLYDQLLKNVPNIQLPLHKTDYADNIYWVYGIVLDKKIKINAEKIMELLANEKIGTRPFFYPMHLQPVFTKQNMFLTEKYPVAENLAEYGFYLPSGLGISNEQIAWVADKFINILKKLN
jgi:perosamine synthetase